MDTNKAKKLLNSLNIIVVGDLMLDKYISGSVSRISPEAPVQVLNIKHEYMQPGGAANVALNIATLGPKVTVFGVVGNDTEGSHLKKILKESKIGTGQITSDRTRNTSTKTRIIAENQQLARLDKESTDDLDAGLKDELISRISNFIDRNKINAVLLSDYNKGLLSRKVVSEITRITKKRRILCVADPKGKDLSRYKGVNILSPNIKEAADLCGFEITDDKSVKKASDYIVSKCGLDGVIMTRGKGGISYKVSKNKIKTIPSEAREVFDVTGAGDTVISTFLVSYLISQDWELSVSTANRAAGIIVSRIGTSSLSRDEFLELLSGQNNNNSKILEIDNLKKNIFEEKKKGKKIIFTNGCFDLLHPGHLMILQKSKELGDILVVALNSDTSVKRLKGSSRPLIKETERAKIISSLDCVDYVTVFSENTPLKTIKHINPDVIVKGGDYTKNQVVGRDHIEKYGGKVVIIPILEDFSTTSIVQKIKNS